MTIYYLVYSAQLNQMKAKFKRSSSFILQPVNDFITRIISHGDHVLTWDTHWLIRAKLGKYADLYYEQSGWECDFIFEHHPQDPGPIHWRIGCI
jgi:hypothetical protein